MGKLAIRKSEIVSLETFLKPFPMDTMMEMTKKSLQRRNHYPGEWLGLEEYYNVVEDLNQFTSKELVFGDKRYLLYGYFDWEWEHLHMEMVVERVNLETSILLNSFSMDLNGYEEYAKDGRFQVKYMLEKFYKFFKEAKAAVNQWNYISSKKKPFIGERPPLEKVREDVLKEAQYLVEDDWNMTKGEFGSFEQYQEDRWMLKSMILHFGFQWHMWDFGPYKLVFNEETIDCELSIFQAFLLIKGVKARLNLFTKFNDMYGDYVAVEDIPRYVDDVIEEVERNIIHWNKTL